MEDSLLKEYFELLGYESVGADPSRFGETVKCAAWWKKWLAKAGFTAEVLYSDDKMSMPPVVYGERRTDDAQAPTVLVYGHYDVQPADPISEWKTPPFKPTVVGDRVYCRGAQDDKGQTFGLLCGIRDFLSAYAPAKINVKVVLEGQEENGSMALTEMLAGDFCRRLAADVLLVCDTSAAAGLRPAIVAGLRGVSHFTLRLKAANRDLHSGEYGGIAPNPAQGMAELVASLHNPDGSIAVAGFRDGIEPPSHDELRSAEASIPDEAGYAADIGCDPVGGQLGRTLAQRNAFEPTIEVNGIHSGYGGEGSKTVIPSEALAKLSMRLVPGQTPKRAYECVKRHLEEREPRGMKLSIEDWHFGAGGFRLPLSSPIFRLAEEVLSKMDGRGPVFMWDGASIPVVSAIREASGAAALIVGWGQAEDRIHSPNESYSFRQLDLAREWGRRIMEAMGAK